MNCCVTPPAMPESVNDTMCQRRRPLRKGLEPVVIAPLIIAGVVTESSSSAADLHRS